METPAGSFKTTYFIVSVVMCIIFLVMVWLNMDIVKDTKMTRICQDVIVRIPEPGPPPASTTPVPHPIMDVVLVVCGSRFEETILTMKSILMFSGNNIHFRVFADQENKPRFDALPFPVDILKKFTYTLYDINLPKNQSLKEWKDNIKPCCTQRLYLPDLLPDVDRVLYSDGDMRFFVPLEEVWSVFDQFNSIQVAALTWHNEDWRGATYSPNYFKFPFYQPYGLNSGLIFMELSRMRSANWTKKMTDYFKQYRKQLVYNDQDLLAIYFYYEPETMVKLDCKYNYRKCYCKNKDAISCLSGLEEGPSIVHGIESSFRTKLPDAQGFYAINGFFEKYNFSLPYESQLQDLLTTLYKMTEEEEKCRKYMTAITKRLREAKI